jgi:predicted amidohydrolase YtcJ
MNLRTATYLLCAVSALSHAQTQPKPKADIIFLHGNVYTGVIGASSFHEVQRAEAIAIHGDRIEAIGSESEILKLKGPSTEVINLDGHFVMPGFNDAHVHLGEAGLQGLTVNLSGVQSLTEFRERIKARLETAAPGEWIVGGGWDETLWPVKELPTRWDIDEVTTDHPVLLQRVDGHAAVANTRALRMASITIASKDPAGGQIGRDSDAQPNGILRDTAIQAVTPLIPPPSHDKRRKALESALQDLAQWGVTSAQDYSGPNDSRANWEDFQIFEEIERDGKLTARISEWLAFDDPLDTLETQRSAHSPSDPMLHTGMLKGFMDGSLGSHSAALLQPYADDPSNSGLPRYDQAKLTQMTKDRVDAGFQIGFHAIGDKGVQMALDAFAEAEKDAREKKIKAVNGGDNYRLRIEHAQVTNPAQIAKFKALKIIASMQPSHLLTDMNWAMARLGPDRAAHSYAWAEFLNSGVILAFGTDYPVEPVNPFRGLYAAVTRKSEDGKKDYFPGEKLTMDQAIVAYTSGAAFAEFAEKDKGKLAPGMLADFVVLDRDLTASIPAKILGAKVLRTVVGGKTVYQAK